MSNLTPFGKRVVQVILGLVLLLAGGLAAQRLGVDPKPLLDAGLRLISATPEPTTMASPVPSATVSPEQEASLY